MEVKKDILFRVYLCFIGIVVLGMFVLGRAFYIQTVEGKFWLGMSDSLHLRNRPIEPNRGTIYSEDGNILSTSVPIFDVYIDFGADGLEPKKASVLKTILILCLFHWPVFLLISLLKNTSVNCN